MERLREVGKRHGRPPGQIAIAWTLRNPAVTAAIVGGRSAKQVGGTVGAVDLQLTKEEVAEIEDEGTNEPKSATAAS